MKSTWLTVPELAAVLKLSVVSIRRAYWKGHLPVIRIGRTVRFNLDQVQQAVQRNGHQVLPNVDHPKGLTGRATGGDSRRRAKARRPRSVRRGRS